MVSHLGVRLGRLRRSGTISSLSVLTLCRVSRSPVIGRPKRLQPVSQTSDNRFAEPIVRGLTGVGAAVNLYSSVEQLPEGDWDAVVVALQPGSVPRIGKHHAVHLAACAPKTAIAQFWGDIDRDAIIAHGLTVWPPSPPTPGHMAVLLSEIGPEPIVRLQTGGLRAAEWVFRGGAVHPDGIAELVDLSRPWRKFVPANGLRASEPRPAPQRD